MKFTQIWRQANVLLEYLLGGGGEYRKVIIQGEGTRQLTLPVTPWKYQITTSQNNKVVDILDFGEAVLLGNTKLQRLKFSCFFPNQERHDGHKYIVGDNYSPKSCIDQIIKWKEAKKPVRVIITDSPVNLMMVIMEFNYNERDGTRDIWYDLSFTEYKELNTPAANNDRQVDDTTGLKERPGNDQEKTANDVNNQADNANGTNEGITNDSTGCVQAPHGCFDNMNNESASAIKGISSARDVLEISKAAYGTYQKLGTLKDKNNLMHVGLKAVRGALKGGAFKI